MDSLNIFENKEIRQVKRPRKLAVILAASAAVPGLGHFLLGKKPVLYWLAGAQATAYLAATLARLQLVPGLLFWPGVRTCFAIWAFAVIDAGLLCVEIGDGRHRDFPIRARLAGFLTLTTYGGGFWVMERRLWAGIALAIGVGVQFFLGAVHPVLRVLSELIVGAGAVWAYSLAAQAHAAKPTRKIVETPQRLRDTAPVWAMPGAIAVSALAVVGAISTGMVGNSLRSAEAVRQDGAIAMEPYYSNRTYGLRLELGSPGWSFAETRPEEFVVARHVAEDALVRLSSKPRVPVVDGPEKAAAQVLRDALDAGYQLTVQGGQARQVAGHRGWELQAIGMRAGARRNVHVVAVTKGWRSYVLWFESGEREQAFAQHELEYLLAHVQLDAR